MSIDAIGAIATAVIDAPLSTSIGQHSTGAAGGTGASFATMLGDGVGHVDASLKTADAQLRALAAGQDIPLHDVMISMEMARTDLMLLAEVRNRIVEGYTELMRMQL